MSSRTHLVILLLVARGAGCHSNGNPLELVGSVERTLVELSAPASEVIVAVPVERGMHVAVGDVAVRLDSTLAEAEVARVEANASGMRTRVAVTKHDLERANDLHRRKIVPEDQVEHAQLAVDEAAARLREAEARLAEAYKRSHDFTIKAPVAGVVDQIPFDLGERVPAGAVVAVLLQDGTPWVRVWVPERAVSQLQPGSAASVRIDGIDPTLTGHVLDIAREPEFTPHFALTERERVHLVYEARVAIDDAPPGLRPGAPASVTIPLPIAKAEASR